MIITRRDSLIRMGLGALGLLVSSGCRQRSAPSYAAGAPTACDGAVGAPSTLRGIGIADLAQRFRDAPGPRALDVAGDAIRAGAGPADVLGATFLAGVQDVRPLPVGDRLHSVMMVESVWELAETAPLPDATLGALWNLDYFKETQADGGGEDDWVLPPAPSLPHDAFADAAAIEAELVAALDAWDAPRADRAIVAAMPAFDREALFEILWPYCGRCIAYIGHKIVYGAHVERVLRRIDWREAQPAMRSLVYALVAGGPGSTGSHDRAVELARELPDGWDKGRDAPYRSLELFREIRGRNPSEAQRIVARALRDGEGVATIQDALRLFAADLFTLRNDSAADSAHAIRAVHPSTELNAFGHAFRATARDSTRRLLMLQAAGWLPELRDALLVRDAIGLDREGLETAVGRRGGGPDAADAAAAHDELARYRAPVFRRSVESHQFKYLAALEQETRVCHPRWAHWLTSPVEGYLPGLDDPVSERNDRALRVLKTVDLV